MEKSYYWDSDIGNVLHQIKTCIESNNFFKNVRQNDRATIKIVFSIIQANIKTCINNIKYNNSHFYEILKKLKIECFNSYKLNDVIKHIKFLITEAVFAGFDREMSHEYFSKYFDSINICLKVIY